MTDRIDFTPLLAQLDAEVLIEELRRRLGVAAQNSEGGALTSPGSPLVAGARDAITTGQIRPDEFFSLSNPEAIRKYLAIMKRPQTPRAIVDGIRAGGVLTNAKNFYANVWTELKRARARGEIVNTPSGWALAEWYPNKPKQNDTPPSKKKGKKKRKPAKVTAKTTAAPTAKKSDWAQFVAEQMKAGKTMKDAAKEWKQRKAASA
jgi:hypothetical protein